MFLMKQATDMPNNGSYPTAQAASIHGSPTSCSFRAVLSLCLHGGLPSHVLGSVGPSTRQRYSMIDHVPGACARCFPGGQAGILRFEAPAGRATSRDPRPVVVRRLCVAVIAAERA